MSIVSSASLKVTPQGSAGLTLAAPASTTSPWSAGAWTEFIASTATTIHFYGICFDSTTSYSGFQFELEVGIGAVGAETVIATIRMYGPNSGNGGPRTFLMPVPFEIPAGSRVVMRQRQSGTIFTFNANLLYFENCDSDNVTTGVKLTCLPEHASHVLMTPSSTPWANGNWAQITSGEGHAISVVGIAFANKHDDVHVEIDIGIGGAGSETVLTTFRSVTAARDLGTEWQMFLPNPIAVPPGTRIAARMRKSGTSTTTNGIALLIYDDTFELNPSLVCNSVTPTPDNILEYTMTVTGSDLEPGYVRMVDPEGTEYQVTPDSYTETSVTWTFTFNKLGTWYVSVVNVDGVESDQCPYTITEGEPPIVRKQWRLYRMDMKPRNEETS